MGARVIARFTLVVLITALGSSIPVRAQSAELQRVLDAASAYVESYVARVQSIIGTETVLVQPLARDFASDGRSRRLQYELRLEPTLVGSSVGAVRARSLVKVDGRPAHSDDLTTCLDPFEPVEFLRAERQPAFVFADAGLATVDGRRAHVVQFRGRQPGEVQAVWAERCGKIDTPGRTRGKVWIDTGSFAVLRLEESLMTPVDLPVPPEQQRWVGVPVLTLERADTTVRYRRVRFEQPAEDVFLPYRIETLTAFQNGRNPRLRMTYQYSDYRRFVTGGRIVE